MLTERRSRKISPTGRSIKRNNNDSISSSTPANTTLCDSKDFINRKKEDNMTQPSSSSVCNNNRHRSRTATPTSSTPKVDSSGDPASGDYIHSQMNPAQRERIRPRNLQNLPGDPDDDDEPEENPFFVGYPVLRGPLKYLLLVLTIVIASLVPRYLPHHLTNSTPTLILNNWQEHVQQPVLQAFTSTHSYLKDQLHQYTTENAAAADSDSSASHTRHRARRKQKEGICQKYANRATHKAVIFDAGSTGSRVHVYSFRCDYPQGGYGSDPKVITLDGERFEHIQPGLSNYANNATAATESLRPLLEIALREVTSDEDRQLTPIFLRATAGLRLLPDRAADEIIERVNTLLGSTPFRTNLVIRSGQTETERIEPAAIMSGLDEGIYAWFTINFLTGKLHNPAEAGVTLDLGGGSTQITFTPQSEETVVTSPEGVIGKRLIDGELESMYSHSYLGYGLMSARKAILAADPTSHILPNSESTTLNPILAWFWAKDNPTTYDHIIIDRHPCFSNSKPKNWTYDGILYVINDEQQNYDALETGSGLPQLSADEMEADFQRCITLATDFVRKAGILAPAELTGREIYALSYFYDRSRDAGIISEDGGQQSHTVTVMELYAAAQAACTRSWPVTDRIKSFLCLDLSYIYAYLRDGLQLELDKEIKLVKKINGIETSWALGAALELLQHL